MTRQFCRLLQTVTVQLSPDNLILTNGGFVCLFMRCTFDRDVQLWGVPGQHLVPEGRVRGRALRSLDAGLAVSSGPEHPQGDLPAHLFELSW